MAFARTQARSFDGPISTRLAWICAETCASKSLILAKRDTRHRVGPKFRENQFEGVLIFGGRTGMLSFESTTFDGSPIWGLEKQTLFTPWSYVVSLPKADGTVIGSSHICHLTLGSPPYAYFGSIGESGRRTLTRFLRVASAFGG